jgi:hypothetical protein
MLGHDMRRCKMTLTDAPEFTCLSIPFFNTSQLITSARYLDIEEGGRLFIAMTA